MRHARSKILTRDDTISSLRKGCDEIKDEEREKFLQQMQGYKEELRDIEEERDEAVAMANDLYKQLCEAEKK